MVRQSGQPGNDGALSRALSQFRPDARRAALRQADHRHCADRLRSFALQSPSPRTRQARARRHHRGRGACVRISGAPDSGDGQAADRGARPQSRLSRPRRNPDGLFHRRRGADDRLRQDDAGLHHGGRDGQHSRDRPLRRTDAQRLASRSAQRLGHRRLAGARRPCRRQDRLRGVHGDRHLVGALGRPLQHDGHGLDHELARRGARHEPARLRGDPCAPPRAGPDRLSDRPANRRNGVGGPEAVGHPDARGVREHDRRQQRHWRLDQRADPHQRHRAPHRRAALDSGLGDDRAQGAAARQHAARRQIPWRRISPRRRRSGRRQRIDEAQAHP